MDSLNNIILLTMAYLITGVALTGYDFSAPPIDRKSYVIHKNYKFAVLLYFIWPIAVLREAYMEHKRLKPYARHLIGVAFLFAGIYMWAKVVYLICFAIISIELIAFIVTGIAMFFGSPIITTVAMPSRRRTRM